MYLGYIYIYIYMERLVVKWDEARRGLDWIDLAFNTTDIFHERGRGRDPQQVSISGRGGEYTETKGQPRMATRFCFARSGPVDRYNQNKSEKIIVCIIVTIIMIPRHYLLGTLGKVMAMLEETRNQPTRIITKSLLANIGRQYIR